MDNFIGLWIIDTCRYLTVHLNWMDLVKQSNLTMQQNKDALYSFFSMRAIFMSIYAEI